MKEFKVPLQVAAQTLADGQTVAPGERFKLKDEEVKENAQLFSEDKLIAVSDAGQELIDKAVTSYQRELAGLEEDLEEQRESSPPIVPVQPPIMGGDA